MCAGAWLLPGPVALADTFTLRNGRELTGDPASYNEIGLIVKKADGTFELRVPWGDFDQPTIKKLMNDPKARFFVEPYLEPEPVVKVKPPPLVLKSVARLDRPAKGSALGQLFSSPVSWTIIVILILALGYAAYEISAYFIALARHDAAAEEVAQEAHADHGHAHPPSAAHGPAPAHGPAHAPAHAPQAHAAEPAPAAGLSLAQAHAPASTIPAPVTYLRGQYTFNRRFFETKLPGFFRVVPSEADKDMVLVVKCARGEFTAQRIARISANEMHLQINKGGASMEEKIPFTEISDVTVKHKDA